MVAAAWRLAQEAEAERKAEEQKELRKRAYEDLAAKKRKDNATAAAARAAAAEGAEQDTQDVDGSPPNLQVSHSVGMSLKDGKSLLNQEEASINQHAGTALSKTAADQMWTCEFSCNFTGSYVDVTDHEMTCPHRPLSGYIYVFDKPRYVLVRSILKKEPEARIAMVAI